MPFKMHKIIFFSRKKNDLKKYVWLPFLKFSELLPETFGLIFFCNFILIHLLHISLTLICIYDSCYFDLMLDNCNFHLSYDVTSESDIPPYIKIDKPVLNKIFW